MALTEAVASIPALRGSPGRHSTRHRMSWPMYQVPSVVDVAALLDERS